jgi:carbohydrate diacid regulator
MFQGMVLQLRDAAERVTGVIDSDSVVVACSALPMIGRTMEEASGLGESTGPVHQTGGYTFKTLASWSSSYDYAVFVEGEDDGAQRACLMAAVALGSAKSFYDEKHDKASFVKNILLGNILPGDIYFRSRDLHFENERSRVVFLVRQDSVADLAVVDVMTGLYPDRLRDFVVRTGERDIVLVKDVRAGTEQKELYQIARTIEDTIGAELQIHTVIGVSSVVRHVKDLATAFKEAEVALEVGKVFDVEKSIIAYGNLGVGRLIYQLPMTMCDMFLAEVFKRNHLDALDQETLRTIHCFFENNLNVSETARKLFVHRNTLVYRLDKIEKLTGLDLTQFDQAVVFKVALMVRKYLLSQEQGGR